MTPIQRGRKLASLRKARGWSRYRLATESGISRDHIGNIERGRKDPTISLLIRIAKALDVPIMTLVE